MALRQTVPTIFQFQLKAVAYAPDGRSGGEFRQLIDADIKA
jgi:hypothetical protein